MERVAQIFDTTQPVNITTGTPPLLIRIREKHEAASHGEGRLKCETEKQDSTATSNISTTTDNSRGDIQAAMEDTEETQAESHEEKGNDTPLAWFSLAMLLLTLSVIAIVIKHRSNNH